MPVSEIRLSKNEAVKLRGILINKTVCLSGGSRARVIAVSRAGLEVVFSSGTKRALPYSAFKEHACHCLEGSCQRETMLVIDNCLKRTRGSADVLVVRRGKTQETKQRAVLPDIDVAANVRLLCAIQGFSEIDLMSHLSELGASGFKTSLQEGFSGEHAFSALREAARYLGCSVGSLLFTPDEMQRYLLDILDESLGWKPAWHKVQALSGSGTLKSAAISNSGLSKTLAFHALKSAGNEGYSRIYCRLFDAAESANDEALTSLEAYAPSPRLIKRFNELFSKAVRASREDNPKLAGSQTPQVKSADPVSTTVTAKPKSEEPGPKPKPVQKTSPKSEAKPAPKPEVKVAAKPAPKPESKTIRVNEFLVRRSYGLHNKHGHSLEPVRATVTILPKRGGDPEPVSFYGYWCPKCKKYFMSEDTFESLKSRGYICCKVIEEKELDAKRSGGSGTFANLASESIVHAYGYNVNQQTGLSDYERQTILSFVIENKIQKPQEIANLLEWLIKSNGSRYNMDVAVGKWEADLHFVSHYKKPTRNVRVDRIYAKR